MFIGESSLLFLRFTVNVLLVLHFIQKYCFVGAHGFWKFYELLFLNKQMAIEIHFKISRYNEYHFERLLKYSKLCPEYATQNSVQNLISIQPQSLPMCN